MPFINVCINVIFTSTICKIVQKSDKGVNGKLLIRSIAGQPSLSTLPIMDRNGNIVKEKMDYADYKKGSKETA